MKTLSRWGVVALVACALAVTSAGAAEASTALSEHAGVDIDLLDVSLAPPTAAGLRCGGASHSKAPKAVAVDEVDDKKKPRPLYANPWFWSAMGVGTATTVALVLTGLLVELSYSGSAVDFDSDTRGYEFPK